MKIIAISGQTCSGKTNIAISLVKSLDKMELTSVVVNTDSRQIYKYLDIGTAKVDGVWKLHTKTGLKAFFYQDVPHYLMDYVDIKTSKSLYSLANFLQDWFCLYKVFQKSGIDCVILVGGSGLYVAGILKGYNFKKFDQQQKLFFEKEKQRLNFLTLEELQEEFEITFYKQNYSIKKPLNTSEHYNPRRLVNKILSQKISKVSSLQATDYTNSKLNSKSNLKLKHVAYFVCIRPDFEELKIKIKNKVFERLDLGLVEEVKKLALSKDLFLSLGLDYRVVFYYLRGFFSKKEMVDRLIIENTKYAKRQMTWIKKQNPIWVKNSKDVLKLLKLLD